MRPLRIVLAVLALAAPLAWAAVAPDFTLRDIDSREVKLSDLRAKNKVVLINFWATWCGPCQVEMPILQKMYETLGPSGLTVIAISTDDSRSSSQVKPLVRSKKLTFPVLLDTQSSVVALYNPAKTLPYTVLVNSAGETFYTHSGYNAGDEVELEKQVRAGLGIP